MNKILTVIIPTYNMKYYLRYCLDSLLVKENFEYLEILVINDGSKDNSSDIAKEYENLYPEVFKVIDKENGNYGSCVNRGLKEAKGKYVKILDADDSFNTANFDNFIYFLIKTDADLILSDFDLVNTDREVKKTIKYRFGDKNIYDFNSICSGYAFKCMQMHAVTYRLENLLSLNYQQTEGISYTDQQWIFLPMIKVKSVACFETSVYKYLIGREGQTINPKNKFRSMEYIARCSADMALAFETHKHDISGDNLIEYLYARIIPLLKDVYVYCFTHYEEKTKNLLIGFDEKLKNISPEIYTIIGSKDVSSFVGFQYIDYWRRNKHINPVVLKLASKAYLFMLNCKKMLRKQDEMSVSIS